MQEPSWVRVASSNSIISRDELVAWLGVPHGHLHVMIKTQGFPPPRFKALRAIKDKGWLTITCRWRVGDVRSWLNGAGNLEAELQKPVKKKLHAWTS